MKLIKSTLWLDITAEIEQKLDLVVDCNFNMYVFSILAKVPSTIIIRNLVTGVDYLNHELS